MAAPSSDRPGVSFLVVGTPRSGTTLVQRLACELPGVGMPPETHFFSLFGWDLARRRRFPLSATGLREEVEAFASLDKSRDLHLDVDAITADLAGTCAGPVEMFAAVVRQLAGKAETYGEKSPEHLRWWRPLSRAIPDVKIIAVVRDPRAVVASMLVAWPPRRQWGIAPYVLRAERWVSDQRQVVAMANALGPERHLLLRYEDVVTDPDRVRLRLATFLGRPSSAESPGAAPPHTRTIVLPREVWKHRTFDPVTSARVGAWKETLRADQAAVIAAICRREMSTFGYLPQPWTSAGSRLRPLTLHPRTQWRRVRFSLGERVRLWRIDRSLEDLRS